MKKIITGILYGVGAVVGVALGITLLWLVDTAITTSKQSNEPVTVTIFDENGRHDLTEEEFRDYMIQENKKYN